MSSYSGTIARSFLCVVLLVIGGPIGCAATAVHEEDEAEHARDKEFVVSDRWSWRQLQRVTKGSFAFAPVIREDGSIPGRCWYGVDQVDRRFREEAREGGVTSERVIDDFFQASELITPDGYIEDQDIVNSAYLAAAGHEAALVLELATGAASCSEAVVGATVIYVAPALAGAVGPATAGHILACGLSIAGVFIANNGVNRNLDAARITDGLEEGNGVGVRFVEPGGHDRILDAVTNLHRDGHAHPAYCPTPEEIAGWVKDYLVSTEVP